MFSDSDLLPISALQHLVYCERQAMLIHLEAAWSENKYTAEGRRLHERTHGEASRLEDGKLIARGLRLVSYRLGLAGVADVVEFYPCGTGVSPVGSCGTGVPPVESDVGPSPMPVGHPPRRAGSGPTLQPLSDTDIDSCSGRPPVAAEPCTAAGVELPGRAGRWRPFPVEYKRGRPKAHDADAVQLCAQALCLEEMLGVVIPGGALFYGQTRRRKEVVFDVALRQRVESCTQRLHQLVAAGVTPPPIYEKKKCEKCSLKAQCLPDRPASAKNYLRRMIAHSLQEASPP